ncbi:MAG: hypothetical protein M1837_000058 [Sclerophora amabilis]|nr:MAG: hypothetical protein M1837_000058 [Sclerophora amabilis]
MTCGSMYYVYWFNKHYIVGAFKAFPDPVAKKLRRALYYSNISESPKDAVRYYREALAVAEQVGMDPYSDEVIGIKVQLAAFLEKINQIQQSIAILNLTRDECLKWFEEGKGREEGEARRRRMLRKLVGMSVKIGELCQHYYVQSPEMAQRNFDWAVTSALMAKNRQDEEKVETEAGTWLTEEEIGATLEAAATFYSQIGQSHLAAPLFLEAIELCPKSDCNVVYLMNGLAVALASNTPSQEAGTHAPDRAVMIDSARQWANKALELAGNIKPPDRTEKCDTGCATVVQNLGQMAESEGNLAEARRRFEEAKSLSKAISHKVGVDLATESLARLDEAADVKDNT